MLKKIVRGFSSVSFRFLLFFATAVAAFVIVFATPIKLKFALKNSGVYDSFIDTVASQSTQQNNKQQNGQGSGNSVSFAQPEIVAAAKQAFPPTLLQESVEKVIDGMYGWAQGKTAEPQFSINLAPIKQNFAQDVGTAAANRLRGLPICTKAQLQQLSTGDINPFTVPCLPPGFNIENERQQLINEIANNKDLLENPTITADSLPKNGNGRTFAQQFAQIPTLYHWATVLPWILGGLTLFFAAIMFLLHDDKRRGLRTIGSAFVGAGSFLIISYLALNWLLNHFSKPSTKSGATDILQQHMTDVAHSLTNNINTLMIRFAIGYVVFGGIILLILWLVKPKHIQPKHHEANANIHKPTSEPTAEPDQNPAPTSKN